MSARLSEDTQEADFSQLCVPVAEARCNSEGSVHP